MMPSSTPPNAARNHSIWTRHLTRSHHSGGRKRSSFWGQRGRSIPMHHSNTKLRLAIQIVLTVLAAGLVWSVAAPAHATEGMSISAEGSDTGDDDDGTLTGGPADEDKKQKAEAAGRKAV